MRYKLTLTTLDGVLIDQWAVCMDRAAQIGDEYLLADRNGIAAQCLMTEITDQINRADTRRKGGRA